jgi:hypothetical protein
MIYRKAPLKPTRLLLKVVTLGAGALVSVACSSNGLEGVAALPPDASDDGGDAQCLHGCGVIPMGAVDAAPDVVEDRGPMGLFDGPADTEGGPVGLFDGAPEEGGPMGLSDGGPMGAVDAPVGVVVNPDAGHD